MPELRPARELAAAANEPYPNDSAARVAAVTELIAEEVELRRHIERVAALRRALPPGGETPPYAFTDENGATIGLADLFGSHDTLVTYLWMYGPQRQRACPMCTAFLDSLDLPARDITQRVALAVLGRSPVSRQLEFARERGWRNLTFAQVGDDFARDYRGLTPDGDEMPALDVWVRRDGSVFHFYGAQLAGTQDPGQDPRGAPDLMPLWNLLDLTPEGRGTDWYPKLEYPDATSA